MQFSTTSEYQLLGILQSCRQQVGPNRVSFRPNLESEFCGACTLIIVLLWAIQGSVYTHRIHVWYINYHQYNIPQMLAYIPYMDPMGQNLVAPDHSQPYYTSVCQWLTLAGACRRVDVAHWKSRPTSRSVSVVRHMLFEQRPHNQCQYVYIYIYMCL